MCSNFLSQALFFLLGHIILLGIHSNVQFSILVHTHGEVASICKKQNQCVYSL